jgi:hypothetical protein
VGIYYISRQIYQFSHVLPLYREIGGALVVHDWRRIRQVKRYLRNVQFSQEERTFLKTPRLVKRPVGDLRDLKGLILSTSEDGFQYNRRTCKSIFLGHGTGDKKYGAHASTLEQYDYHFISGPKHIEKIREQGLRIPEERFVKIGNLVFDDYLNGKVDREQQLARLGIRDRSRHNVLYAPTWQFGQGTFHQWVYPFAREITKRYNLIIRPHFHDRRYLNRVRLWARLNGIKNVYFSNPAAVVACNTMLDFAASDILISDTSSILYEYLVTRKPIVVVQNGYDGLHRMPSELDIMACAQVFDGSQDILQVIAVGLADKDCERKCANLLNACFYFNDGRAVERARTFVASLDGPASRSDPR